jgi:hypothetical protein
MTTDLRVTLHHPVPVAAAITVIGRRAEVRTKTDDGRYYVTRLAAFAEDGGVAATAQITFVAVRGAAKRLVTGLLAMNDAAVLHRVFPAYTSTR